MHLLLNSCVQREHVLERMMDFNDSMDDELLPSGRGKITIPFKFLKKIFEEWWKDAPGWIRDTFHLNGVLNAMDTVFEVSDNIEDFFYRAGKLLGANDGVAWTFSKAVSIIFLPREIRTIHLPSA